MLRPNTSDMTSDMTRDTTPIANPNAVPLLVEREGEIPLLDFGARTLHRLNPTAAALLLSCDGHTTVDAIATQLAAAFDVGASTIVGDVERGLASLQSVGLVRRASDPDFPAPAVPPVVDGPSSGRYPAVVPCSCGTGIEAMPWAPTFSVAVGDIRVGVRANDGRTDERARAALAAVTDEPIRDDPDAPPKLSLALGDGAATAPVVRTGLFEDQQWLAMSPDDDWLLRWLVQRVAGWRALGADEVRLGALALVGPQGAALLPYTRGGDNQYVTQSANGDLELHLAPVFVDTKTGSLRSRSRSGTATPVVVVLAMGAATKRLDRDDALVPLLSMADVRPGDDLDAVADGLDRLARTVPTIEAAPTDIAAVAAALVRRR
jgi:hypothetical protein